MSNVAYASDRDVVRYIPDITGFNTYRFDVDYI